MSHRSKIDGHAFFSDLQMVVNIGGAVSRGYELAHRNLFGQELRSAPDGSSFVTHWMLVYKPLMLQFLGSLGNASVPETWAWRVLDAVDPAHLNLGMPPPSLSPTP